MYGSNGYDANMPRAPGVSVGGGGGGVMNLLDLDDDVRLAIPRPGRPKRCGTAGLVTNQPRASQKCVFFLMTMLQELAEVTPHAAQRVPATLEGAGGAASLAGLDVNSAQGLASALGDLNMAYART